MRITFSKHLRSAMLAAMIACVFVVPKGVAQVPGGCASITNPTTCALYSGYCQSCNGNCIDDRDICILEPIPGIGAESIPASDIADLGAFRRYVNGGVWQWAFGIGIAIAVLNGAIGGLEIVLSNGDSGKVEAGKTRFFWSAMGLVLLLLSGVILEFINPLGFLNV